jgi:hypothetical protein
VYPRHLTGPAYEGSSMSMSMKDALPEAVVDREK